MADAGPVVRYLDDLLRVPDVPDYPGALNGLQVQGRRPIRKVAAAVDASRHVIETAIGREADLLLVHHGMFWSGVQPLTGAVYDRVRMLISSGMALYSAHLPLDAHPEVGNNVLLASELGLQPSAGFATYQGFEIGVRGNTETKTAELLERARAFARKHGGDAIATRFESDRITRKWAVCTGAGASADTLREATELGVDTLVVGEGPHWTAVEAPERGLVIIYAGHYATETLGVRALADRVAAEFGIEATFVESPTGL